VTANTPQHPFTAAGRVDGSVRLPCTSSAPESFSSSAAFDSMLRVRHLTVYCSGYCRSNFATEPPVARLGSSSCVDRHPKLALVSRGTGDKDQLWHVVDDVTESTFFPKAILDALHSVSQRICALIVDKMRMITPDGSCVINTAAGRAQARVYQYARPSYAIWTL